MTFVGTHAEVMRLAQTLSMKEKVRVKVTVGTRLSAWPQWNLWRLELINE